MAFLISAQTLGQAWENAQNIGVQIKAGAQSIRAESVAGPVSASRILNYERELRSFRARLEEIAAMPGLAAHVTALANTPQGYNVATEYTALRTQIDATTTWIRTNFPKDANGYLLERTLSAEGPVERTFTTAQLAAFRTQLDALIAAIG